MFQLCICVFSSEDFGFLKIFFLPKNDMHCSFKIYKIIKFYKNFFSQNIFPFKTNLIESKKLANYTSKPQTLVPLIHICLNSN